MFWRVEISEEGGIFSVERCEEKGTNGRRVIYVQADTKEHACAEAKAWYERYKARHARLNSRRVPEARDRGLCIHCFSNPAREGKTTCIDCQLSASKYQRDIREGLRVKRKKLRPEEAIEAFRATQKRYRGRQGIFTCHSRQLINRARALGDNGPLVQWIIAEQERRAAEWRAANPEPEEEQAKAAE